MHYLTNVKKHWSHAVQISEGLPYNMLSEGTHLDWVYVSGGEEGMEGGEEVGRESGLLGWVV